MELFLSMPGLGANEDSVVDVLRTNDEDSLILQGRSKMPYARVVIKPQVEWSDVLTTGNSEKKWKQGDDTFLTQDEVYTKWWKSVDGCCVIAYMQDPIRELRYYHLTGTDLETHVAIIRKRLAAYDRGEIEMMMAAARTPAEKVVAVYHAAAFAPPEPDPAILDFLTRSLVDAEPAVRRAAVDAALVALWPDLDGPLERVAAMDQDADLQAFARETLGTLQNRVWAAAPGTFDFAPLPPDKSRINPLTGVGDDWYEEAHHKRPEPRAGAATVPVPSRNPEFHPPDWLIELMRQGDWEGIRWDTLERIRAAASQFTEFTEPTLMILSDSNLDKNRALWESMVPVAEGRQFTDRGGRTEPSRLFVNRDDPLGLLLALGADHPPSLWVPAG